MMIMRIFRPAPTFRLALTGVILAGILAGCGKKEQQAALQPATPIPLPEHPLIAPCEPGIPGGRLVIATFIDPKTLNPTTPHDLGSPHLYHMLLRCLVTS